MASLRSLRLGGFGFILGLAAFIVVCSSSTPATTKPDRDGVATPSSNEGEVFVIPTFAQRDTRESPSSISGVHPSWDGSVGDGFGAANMQVSASVSFACDSLWRLPDTPLGACYDRGNTLRLNCFKMVVLLNRKLPGVHSCVATCLLRPSYCSSGSMFIFIKT